MHSVFAQGEPLGTIGGGGLGPFGNLGKSLDPNDPIAGGTLGLTKVTDVISSIVGFMTISAGVWFILQFLTGGFHWITSSGDKAKLEQARDRLTNAFVGLLIVVAAWSILALAGQFLGYDILLLNRKGVIESLGIK